MILDRVYDPWGSLHFQRLAYVHDLRQVVARLMGRQELSPQATQEAFRFMPRDGQWQVVDGGALRVRRYLKGTVHLEIHPDVVVPLNKVLATLYPLEIPANAQARRQSRACAFEMSREVLSQRLCDDLCEVARDLRAIRGNDPGDPGNVSGGHGVSLIGLHLQCREEVEALLHRLGGVRWPARSQQWRFEIDIRASLREVARSALMPPNRAR